ncbi:serine/threonine-protein phosphatase 2A activator-like [Anneissia japonica]|uniref:serine/threonine-protein phosphatase 2A activator-like n=1 Tax=Anneissia japonica TaxID=1529436 RepID=UPI001425A77C|nr:serine/threonine-protein phosphatase 2A activator-like [Anneissia japonica]
MSSSHAYTLLKKEIKTIADLSRWQKSQAFKEYQAFIETLNNAVKGKKVSDDIEETPQCKKLLELLDTLSMWIDEIPPVDQPQRFGNKAYRTWLERLTVNSETLLKNIIEEKDWSSIIELQGYFNDGFGNSTRIDYGTGHEMNFASFLCCLFKLRYLTDQDYEAVVLRVFCRYLTLMRKLQTVYKMEPAGSHGVWGLDDFQFLPFIWGSSQLISHSLKPEAFIDPVVAKKSSHDFMFMACIAYINEVKTGPFAEHSNILWGISSIPHWTKVNSGLLKMYKAEVLLKFPVIQHFSFGTMLSINPAEV